MVPAQPRVLAVVAALGLALVAAAQARARPAKAAPPAPDWNGIWVIADSFMDKQDGTSVAAPGRLSEAPGRPAIPPPQMKGVYLARQEAVAKAAAAGKPIEDTGAQCLPQGMPKFWGGPYAFEIVQTARQINLSQEWNEQTRRIYLDGRRHPTDLDASYNGHSIGRWQGRTLVDTAAIRAETGVGAGNGVSHSDAMHIVERLEPVGADQILVTMTVDDPQAFVQPWVTTTRLRRKTGMEMQEYVCEENNRNTPDAQGVTQAVIAPR